VTISQVLQVRQESGVQKIRQRVDPTPESDPSETWRRPAYEPGPLSLPDLER